MICQVCDRKLKKQKYGRPRDYCNDNCADFAKFQRAWINALEKISLSTESSKQIRGDLFRLANEIKQREAKT